MFMSRQLEKMPRTKLRRQAEEVDPRKKKVKQREKARESEPKGFDMWEGDNAGC